MTKEEFEAKYKANRKIEGHGMNVKVHMPCPCCAAPDWLIYPVTNEGATTNQPAQCKECKRTLVLRAVKPNEHQTFLRIEQLDGDPAPPYSGVAVMVPATHKKTEE